MSVGIFHITRAIFSISIKTYSTSLPGKDISKTLSFLSACSYWQPPANQTRHLIVPWRHTEIVGPPGERQSAGTGPGTRFQYTDSVFTIYEFPIIRIRRSWNVLCQHQGIFIMRYPPTIVTRERSEPMRKDVTYVTFSLSGWKRTDKYSCA